MAVHALRAALREGDAPGRAPQRSSFQASAGEILIMPSEMGAFAGVKLISVNDGTARPDVPRIQGIYLFGTGKLADFTVLSHDPLAIDHQGIADIQVLATVVGGQVAYERSAGGW